MIYRQHGVDCDHESCDNGTFLTEEEAVSKADVRLVLRSIGWTFGKRDLCPIHSKKIESKP